MTGLCQCGCGKPTSIPTKNCTSLNRVKGVPMRFLPGHSSKGPLHNNWKGGRSRTGYKTSGYIKVYMPTHPRACRGYVLEHIVIAENALRASLPPKAEIHHVDGDGRNNVNNLVICENVAYHRLLHQRTRAYLACGNAEFRKCQYCKKYDDSSRMSKATRGTFYHNPCHSSYELARTRKG